MHLYLVYTFIHFLTDKLVHMCIPTWSHAHTLTKQLTNDFVFQGNFILNEQDSNHKAIK